MADVIFLVELLWSRLNRIGKLQAKIPPSFLKLPFWGCTVTLLVGCSTLPLQQAATVSQPAASLHPFEAPTTGVPKMHLDASQQETSATKSQLIIPNHAAIDEWVAHHVEETPKSFQACLDRARPYVKQAREIFQQQGLPPDLVYVALVESGFSPTAKSPANAVGMWQFISATGKRFGLRQNRWIDERRHPFKAARAAAEYLSFLYDTFQSWPLALAAYNAGEKRVQDALEATGFETFWELAENGSLPKETRDYVPKVLAAIRIINQPERFGFRFDPEECTAACATINVPGGISLAWLSEQVDIEVAELETHNPEICNGATPPGQKRYALCVPAAKRKLAAARLSNLSLTPGAFAAVPYKVKRGDTLYGLAKQFGSRASLLAAFNRMRLADPLVAGKTIRIPLSGSQNVASRKSFANLLSKRAVAASARKQRSVSNPASADRCRLASYKVRAGDTLWSIARRFETSLNKILTHNTLKPEETLHTGRVLTICVAESHFDS
ncbi:lytic transglycosylase domain-containing protein [Desulfoferrobacter suflitae]|uniref:lytic transglycosylase domain-containing protein n=1 Tax=Desulfoferrobacter suflitae TaxID=2865782 RepID=UPI002164C124|nr:lytic transglycosylase domain-containing protein [Desulfoferrobacter suflitae]MCK8603670.1 transglycosylase SLT domain-containing protein [Desulfoferrobacter suflitae]